MLSYKLNKYLLNCHWIEPTYPKASVCLTTKLPQFESTTWWPTEGTVTQPCYSLLNEADDLLWLPLLVTHNEILDLKEYLLRHAQAHIYSLYPFLHLSVSNLHPQTLILIHLRSLSIAALLLPIFLPLPRPSFVTLSHLLIYNNSWAKEPPWALQVDKVDIFV